MGSGHCDWGIWIWDPGFWISTKYLKTNNKLLITELALHEKDEGKAVHSSDIFVQIFHPLAHIIK